MRPFRASVSRRPRALWLGFRAAVPDTLIWATPPCVARRLAASPEERGRLLRVGLMRTEGAAFRPNHPANAIVVAVPSPGSDLRANRCRPPPACGRGQAAAAREAIGKAGGSRAQWAQSPPRVRSQSTRAARALRSRER